MDLLPPDLHPLSPAPPEEVPRESVRIRRGTRKALLRLLARAGELSARLEEALSRHHLTLEQFEVLEILRRAGPEGLPRRALSHALPSRAPDVTRLLDRLDRRGLVERGSGREDRRLRMAALTPRGTELLRTVRPEVDRVLAAFAGRLPRRNLRKLSRLLSALGD